MKRAKRAAKATRAKPTAAERAKLASCAPEMARLLLRVEWTADGNFASCHFCSGLRPEDADFLKRRSYPVASYHCGHRDDCVWLAVMRKAGLR